MGQLFFWTGALVWVLAAMLCLRGAYLAGEALCVAADWVRWQLAICKAHETPFRWSRLPGILARRWLYFAAHGYTNTTWTGQNGYWTGFRKWGVHLPDSKTHNGLVKRDPQP